LKQELTRFQLEKEAGARRRYFVDHGGDRAYAPLFSREFRYGDYSLLGLTELRQGKTVIGKVFKNFRPGNVRLDGGEHCWQMKKGRSVDIKLQCGEREQLVDVYESSPCEYKAVLVTASACDDEALKDLERLSSSELRNIGRYFGIN
jgi:hypothetical protein